MIHQAERSVESLWQKELKQSFSDPLALLNFLSLDPLDFAADIDARKLFPMRVPRFFAELMQKNNPTDPLLLQVLPRKSEFKQVDGFTSDPLLEQNNSTPGLLHKYRSRVLIIFKSGCAVNCRYCFRRDFPYEENQVNKQQLLQHLAYIESHPEINEVILSGGDPLMAKDEHIAWFVEQLELIKHIKRLRLHTRLPVVMPNRITEKLIAILSKTRLKSSIVFHINHQNEISDMLAGKCHQLRIQGIHLFNQAVILKGINNTIKQQVELSERLYDVDILPYYLHLLDKVVGAAHFDVPEDEVKQIYRGMLAELPGFLVPKLVREIGGETSKTPVLPY
ncbi:EF-P beta-lysylation protein EpmB [Psychrosphaera sp. B3R10]|uniref:EF-P beta-lysylation protein EpmB n=1 Tax=unclassified Psychrosphaera TaxID=2641570 RepID=UPI001C09DC6A|nr:MULTISPECIES: EF-P beta-lysylation protein EpmB [unclassified Psychrosphaera]MBU2882621.1 EF-P beta-lysylation protein EpmB [Psychrosphaera sp. I2R16]MBU2989360.1 EF-P beta-lysylation protein EpmB [Psychrosphaera sp. B3R10]MDO6718194.1 EF-P beta-lysylation protein EpmB [Psychrosphaera sp. 1_MG-2023]